MFCTVEKIAKVGERIFTLKRVYNLKCGIKAEDDVLPKIVLQPVKGGSEGRIPDVRRQVEEYYEYRNWPNGIPSKEKLKELELDWVE